MFPQNSCPHESQNVIFANRVFADVLRYLAHSKSNDWVLVSREEDTQRHREEGLHEGGGKDWRFAATRQGRQEPQELEEAKEIFFPRAFKRIMALPTSRVQTSDLCNCERINFYCIKPQSL